MRSQLGVAAIAYFASGDQVYGAAIENKIA